MNDWWPKEIQDIYKEACRRLGSDGEYPSNVPLHFGPAHIVWEDGNFDSAEWCLENFDRYTDRFTKEEMDVVKWSLQELVKLPLEVREVEIDDDDDTFCCIEEF